jgi:hypothetical protein
MLVGMIGRDHFVVFDLDDRILLEWILKKQVMRMGKRPLGIPRRRWVDNIKIDLREIGWDGMVWTGSIWLRIGTSGGLL